MKRIHPNWRSRFGTTTAIMVIVVNRVEIPIPRNWWDFIKWVRTALNKGIPSLSFPVGIIPTVCQGIKVGDGFPYFGCASDITGKVARGCFETGGCYYRDKGQEYPYSGFCTYKTYNDNNVIVIPTTPTPPSLPLPSFPFPFLLHRHPF